MPAKESTSHIIILRKKYCMQDCMDFSFFGLEACLAFYFTCAPKNWCCKNDSCSKKQCD